MGSRLLLRGRHSPPIGNSKSRIFFRSIFIAIVIFVYCSSKRGALLQYHSIQSSPSSWEPSVRIFLWCFQAVGSLRWKGALLTENLPGLIVTGAISTIVIKSVQPCMRCGFLLLLTYSVNNTFFLYPVLCVTVVQNNCHDLVLVLFPRELKRIIFWWSLSIFCLVVRKKAHAPETQVGQE